MKPSRVDFLTDLAYGGLIFLSVVLIVQAGTEIGVAFGFGVLVSYVVHVGWKMGRFDPEWMSKEVKENIEKTLTEEVTESVSEKVTDEVTENVEEKVAEEVTENVEETLSEEIDSVIDKVDEVNERVDRRPREADDGAEEPSKGDEANEGDEDERTETGGE